MVKDGGPCLSIRWAKSVGMLTAESLDAGLVTLAKRTDDTWSVGSLVRIGVARRTRT